jgi:hypothetical protein
MQINGLIKRNSLIISIYTTLILTILIACSPGKKPSTDEGDKTYPYRIDLTQHTKSNLYLSDFAIDIDYIPLETGQVMIGGELTVYSAQDRYIINDLETEVTVFNLDGEFLQKIGRRGPGPDEYLHVIPCTYDSQNHQYILPISDRAEIKFYNEEGQFIKKIDCQGFKNNLRLICWNSKYLVTGQSEVANPWKAMVIYNPDGSVFKDYLVDLSTLERAPETVPMVRFNPIPGGPVMLDGWSMDTTFILLPDGELAPYLIFDRGTNPMPQSERFLYGGSAAYIDHNYYAWAIRDVGPLLILNLELPPGNTHPAFFRKDNNGVYEISNFERNKEEGTVGIQNDLDGGPAFIWQFTQDDQYAYCVHQAINLIDGKAEGAFDRINPKLPAKKQELTEMIEQLKPDDNPVIMRVKLKNW